MTTSNEEAIEQLSLQLSNYTERVADRLDCPEAELWMLHLGAMGRMRFLGDLEPRSTLRERVPDESLLDGRSRHELWELALREVIRILGDPESRYRTGYNMQELTEAVDAFYA